MQIVFIIIYLVVPTIFLCNIWKSRTNSFFYWVSTNFAYLSYFLSIFFTGVWGLSPVYNMRRPLMIALIVLLCRSYLINRKKFNNERLRLKKKYFAVINYSLGLYFMFGVISACSDFLCKSQPVHLSFPLKSGKFCIVHGGNSKHTNHHHYVSAQKYALDIVKIANLGWRSTKLFPERVEDFHIFGAKIYSPCNGFVLETHDSYNDLPPMDMDPKHPAGNYVVIEMDNSDAVVLLAHLKKDSIRVSPGERVATNTVIGMVGNSGNTSEPHLHIHAVSKKSKDFLFDGEAIPMSFNQRSLIRNMTIQSCSK